MAEEQAFRAIGPTTYLCPVPVVLIGCQDEAGKPNFMTAAWAGVCCSKPPIIGVGIKPERLSHGLIQRAGAFTVNLVSEELCEAADLFGVRSGREIAKPGAAGLHAMPAPPVAAPALAEAPAHLCCRLKQIVPLGSHDLFLGAVEQVYVGERFFRPDGSIDEAAMRLVGYVHGKYRALGAELGFFGYSVADEKVRKKRMR